MVSIELPLIAPPESGPPRGVAASTPATTGERLLVVDDEPAVRSAINT